MLREEKRQWPHLHGEMRSSVSSCQEDVGSLVSAHLEESRGPAP